MKFENTEVWGFEHAIRGMRNPLQSHCKSDSKTVIHHVKELNEDFPLFTEIGKNDLDLAQRLIKAGSEHRKFLRQIFIQTTITANVYEWLKFESKFIDKTPLPDNFENMDFITRICSFNYEVALEKKNKFGNDFQAWLKTLPYAKELLFIGD